MSALTPRANCASAANTQSISSNKIKESLALRLVVTALLTFNAGREEEEEEAVAVVGAGVEGVEADAKERVDCSGGRGAGVFGLALALGGGAATFDFCLWMRVK